MTTTTAAGRPMHVTPTQMFIECPHGSLNIDEMTDALYDAFPGGLGRVVALELAESSPQEGMDWLAFHADDFDRLETIERAIAALDVARDALKAGGYVDLATRRLASAKGSAS